MADIKLVIGGLLIERLHNRYYKSVMNINKVKNAISRLFVILNIGKY